MTEETFNPIVVHKRSQVPYVFLGGTKFRNLHTGAEGEVGEDKAALVFNFHAELSDCINEHPLVQDLISKLKLIVK